MSEYMSSVFTVSAVFALLGRLSYKSSLDGARRAAFGILLVFAVISPVIEGANKLSEVDIDKLVSDYESFEDAGGEVAIRAIEDGIRRCIGNEFNIKEENLKITLENFSVNEGKAERIRVILCGAAISADYKKIEKYVESLGLGECDAEIEIG